MDIQTTALPVLSALGVVAALMMSAPSALAEPTAPTPLPPPPVDAAAAPVAVGPEAPPAGTPHLSSLENLPPGTTIAPAGPQEGHGLGYLRDLWHALRTQEISGNDALLLLTQRPLNPDAAPPPGVSAGPQPPLPPETPPPAP